MPKGNHELPSHPIRMLFRMGGTVGAEVEREEHHIPGRVFVDPPLPPNGGVRLSRALRAARQRDRQRIAQLKGKVRSSEPRGRR